MGKLVGFISGKMKSFKNFSKGKKIVLVLISFILLMNIATAIGMFIDKSIVTKKEIAEEEARQRRAEEASVARMQKEYEESQKKAQEENFKNLEKEQDAINKRVRESTLDIINEDFGSENVTFNNVNGVNMIGITSPGIALEYVLLDENNESRVYFENQAKKFSKTISDKAIELGSNEEFIILILNDQNRQNALAAFYNGDSYDLTK